MCGRFTLTADAERLYEEFGIGVPPEYEPRWNIAPGQTILAVAEGPDGPRAGWLLWGLVPGWRGKAKPLVNLRAEGAHRTAPRLLERRRCLIPADGFYEWKRADGRKQPQRIHRPDGRLLAMAALWDRRREGEADEGEATVAILTVPAVGVVRGIHDRMPLILEGEARSAWLARETPRDTLADVLRATPPALDAYPVSTRVNDVRNDDAGCAAPVGAAHG